MKKIAAVVVLYNPDDEVIENINSYASEVDLLIVVDNSTTHNHNLVAELTKKYLHLLYVNNEDNVGIATALNIACDKALENSFQWILTMDQDSSFINFNHYKKCLNYLKEHKDVALLTCNTMRDAQKHVPNNPGYSYEEKFMEITSGNLLNLSLFNEIGRFEDKLFIDMVDYDYCLKVNMLHYKILSFKDVYAEHNVGEVIERKNIFTKKMRKKIEHNTQRNYYMTRNYLYISHKYSHKFYSHVNLLKAFNILFIHGVTKILLYEDNKYQKLRAKFIGLYHFIISKYGKYTIK